MLDFDHADIAFGQIIVEWYGEIGEEGEHLGTTVAQAVEEVRGRRVFGTTSGGQGRRSDFIQRVVENAKKDGRKKALFQLEDKTGNRFVALPIG